MSHHHVIYNILVCWACFVIGRPSTVEELKALLLNKLLDKVLLFFSLSIVPH